VKHKTAIASSHSWATVTRSSLATLSEQGRNVRRGGLRRGARRRSAACRGTPATAIGPPPAAPTCIRHPSVRPARLDFGTSRSPEIGSPCVEKALSDHRDVARVDGAVELSAEASAARVSGFPKRKSFHHSVREPLHEIVQGGMKGTRCLKNRRCEDHAKITAGCNIHCILCSYPFARRSHLALARPTAVRWRRRTRS